VVADGGTGTNTLTANNVILGNGTSAVAFVAPGSNGNLLTSNGTTWTSAAPPAGGVTSLNGQTGAITNTNADVIGSVCIAMTSGTATSIGGTTAASALRGYNAGSGVQTNPGFNGTWRNTGSQATVSTNVHTIAAFMRVS
jgi:hypothetical protein